MSINDFPNLHVVSYFEARDQIRSGDFLLCSGTGLFPRLIRLATRSIWSHVAFILRIDSIDRIMVLESVETKGVRAVPLSSYVSNYNGSGKPYAGDLMIARHADFDSSKIGELSRRAVDLLGYPYDYLEIAKITARIALSRLHGGRGRPRDMNDAFICSEYAADCAASVGINIPHDSRGFITPADFAKDQKMSPVCSILKA